VLGVASSFLGWIVRGEDEGGWLLVVARLVFLEAKQQQEVTVLTYYSV
jgi:hypothetical protein